MTSIIRTPAEFQALLEFGNNSYFKDIILDLETNSAAERRASIWGIALAFDAEEAFYIPVRDKNERLLWSEAELKSIYAEVTNLCIAKRFMGWNLVYDTLVWKYNTGYELSQHIDVDGILLKHVVDETRPFALKEVAVKYLGAGSDKSQKDLYENIKVNGGKTTKTDMQMWKADTEVLAEYAGQDVLLTKRLIDLFEPKLKEQALEDLFYQEVMPLYKHVTISMKDEGVHIDVPRLTALEKDISLDIVNLEREVQRNIRPEVQEYVDKLLEEEFPVKKTGNFPKYLARVLGIELPEKNGKVSLTKAVISNLKTTTKEQEEFVSWLSTDKEFTLSNHLRESRELQYWEKYPEDKYIFNLSSNHHLGWLFFDKLGFTPEEFTETGRPKIGADELAEMSSENPIAQKIIEFKKLQKIHKTYILGILERQIDGVLYSSFLQFGTTSGRYSSTNPNLQNIPRTKDEDSGLSPLILKYVNEIRACMVSKPGYSFVDADQSALEPRCFSSASGDKNLQAIFFSGEDMYSAIAKKVYMLNGSTFKKDADFIGTKFPEKRQLIKVLALAVVYGAGAHRIADITGMTKDSAQEVIDMYFEAYPDLKKYIDSCHKQAKDTGMVRTKFGRIRHLDRVQEIHKRYGSKITNFAWVKQNAMGEVRSEMKGLLNNSTNFPIQGLAAHIMNRAAIAVSKRFTQEGIDGRIVLQIHDQLVCQVRDDQLDRAKLIVQDCMENTTKIDVPLVAEPKVAKNLKDSH